jgi:hypothetical protein
MKDMKKEDSKKMEWESVNEYQYRIKVHDVMTRVSQTLGSLESLKTNFNFNCVGLQDSIKKALNEIRSIPVPEMYTESHKVILNCIQAYRHAMDLLVDGIAKKDAPLTYKAGRYIHEGNAWMVIAKTRIWEEVEKKEGEESARSRNL